MSKFIVKYSENQNTFDSHFTEKDIGFRTKNSDYFKKIVSFINTSIDQINFRIGTDGIYIISMDGSHIALLECFIPKEFFSTYNVDKEILIGINLNILMKILNHVKSNDELIFKIDYNKDIVNLLFINEKYTKYYKLKLLEIDQDNLEIVDLENMIELTIDSKYFNDIIKDFNDIGEDIKINIDREKETINFNCKGDMIDFSMNLNNDSLEYRNLENIDLDFNIKYIQTFTKGNLSKNINIKLTNDFPLKMSYSILNNGYINYYLAPKITDDE